MVNKDDGKFMKNNYKQQKSQFNIKWCCLTLVPAIILAYKKQTANQSQRFQ